MVKISVSNKGTLAGVVHVGVGSRLQHVQEHDDIAVMDTVLFQGFLVVQQRFAIEIQRDVFGWEARFNLTKRLKILQFQVFRHIQDEDLIVERGYSNFHGEILMCRYETNCALRGRFVFTDLYFRNDCPKHCNSVTPSIFK